MAWAKCVREASMDLIQVGSMPLIPEAPKSLFVRPGPARRYGFVRVCSGELRARDVLARRVNNTHRSRKFYFAQVVSFLGPTCCSFSMGHCLGHGCVGFDDLCDKSTEEGQNALGKCLEKANYGILRRVCLPVFAFAVV